VYLLSSLQYHQCTNVLGFTCHSRFLTTDLRLYKVTETTYVAEWIRELRPKKSVMERLVGDGTTPRVSNPEGIRYMHSKVVSHSRRADLLPLWTLYRLQHCVDILSQSPTRFLRWQWIQYRPDMVDNVSVRSSTARGKTCRYYTHCDP